MTRVSQPSGEKGSLKWIQRAVNLHPHALDRLIVDAGGISDRIEWLSPKGTDSFSEYRDDKFLDVIGHGNLKSRLANFWPRRGPQWDALAKSNAGQVLLVEAKAHIGEICSSGSGASEGSRLIIERSLSSTVKHMAAKPRAPWVETFYQLANRYAHLHFLREQGVDAWLVLVNFVDDDEMRGPKSAAEWRAAYQIVDHVMGIPKRHPLERFLLHIYPNVRGLS